MRDINEIILHCADTRTDQNFDIDDIKKWHTDPKSEGGRGWSDIGYHFVILLDGTIQNGLDIDKSGAHCKGFNSKTIGVCFMGGMKADGARWDSCSIEQKGAFTALNMSLDIITGQKLKVSPHSDYSSKTCPNFDIKILC